MRHLGLIVCAGCLLLLSACGANNASTALQAAARSQPAAAQPATAAMAGLPAVAELAALPHPPRGASLVESDYIAAGDSCHLDLPHRAVALINAGTASFQSSDIAAEPGFGAWSYAIYEFVVPGYDRDPALYVLWQQPPDFADRSAFVLLSNWANGRWDSYPLDAGDKVDLINLPDYLQNEGVIYVVLAVRGLGADCELSQLRLGGVPPSAVLTASTQLGHTPLTVDFDASGSSADNGGPLSFEWDPEGDGSYISSAGLAQFQHSYDAQGSYSASLRVTDELGNSATAELPVRAVGDWTHSFGRSSVDSIDAVLVDSDSNIYLAGTSSADSGPLDLLLMKLDPLGQVIWQRSFDNGGEDSRAHDLAFDPEGNIVVGGNASESGDLQALVQRWSPNGALLMSSSFGDDLAQIVRRIRVAADGKIYIAGESGLIGLTLLVGRLSADGQLDWALTHSPGSSLYCEGLDLKTGITGLVTGVTTVSSAVNQLWRLDTDSNGTASSSSTLGDAGSPMQGGGIDYSYNFLNSTSTYRVSGLVKQAGQMRPFYLVFNSGAASVSGAVLSSGDFGGLRGLNIDVDSNSVLLFGNDQTSGDRTAVLRLSLDGGLQSSRQFSGTGLYANAVAVSLGGVLLCGSGQTDITAFSNPYAALPFSASWQSASDSATVLSWTANVSQPAALDLAGELQQDVAVGSSESLVQYLTVD